MFWKFVKRLVDFRNSLMGTNKVAIVNPLLPVIDRVIPPFTLHRETRICGITWRMSGRTGFENFAHDENQEAVLSDSDCFSVVRISSEDLSDDLPSTHRGI